MGIKLKLICEDENYINEARLKFFDWEVHLLKKKTKKTLTIIKKYVIILVIKALKLYHRIICFTQVKCMEK